MLRDKGWLTFLRVLLQKLRLGTEPPFNLLPGAVGKGPPPQASERLRLKFALGLPGAQSRAEVVGAVLAAACILTPALEERLNEAKKGITGARDVEGGAQVCESAQRGCVLV